MIFSNIFTVKNKHLHNTLTQAHFPSHNKDNDLCEGKILYGEELFLYFYQSRPANIWHQEPNADIVGPNTCKSFNCECPSLYSHNGLKAICT